MKKWEIEIKQTHSDLGSFSGGGHGVVKQLIERKSQWK